MSHNVFAGLIYRAFFDKDTPIINNNRIEHIEKMNTETSDSTNNPNKSNNKNESVYKCPNKFQYNAGLILDTFHEYSVDFVDRKNITTRIESHKLNNDTCKLVVNMFSSNTFNENKNSIDTLVIESIPFECKNENKPPHEYVDTLIHGLNYYLYRYPDPRIPNIKKHDYTKNTSISTDKNIEHIITIKNEKNENNLFPLSLNNFLIKINNFISDIGISTHDIKIKNTLSAFLELNRQYNTLDEENKPTKKNIFNYSANKFEINNFDCIEIGKIEYKFINDTNKIFPQLIQNKNVIDIFNIAFKKIYGLDYYKTSKLPIYYNVSDSNISMSDTQ